MAVIVLRLEDFKAIQQNRPKHCPYCGCEFLQRWGSGSKAVQDTQAEIGDYHRYRCNACQRTFRHYASGVDRTHLTQRIRKIAGLAWALGLSAREVVDLLKEPGIEMSYMTVWREGNDLLKRLQAHFGPHHPGRYSIDQQFLKIKSRGIGTSIIVELRQGQTIALGRMDEVDYRKILSWLEWVAQDIDVQISVIGTDVLFDMNLPSKDNL
jgi:DNA-directed RNA polymerase subunit RPC12/RpoP